MATKKSVWATLGVILILAAWEVSGTLVEHRNVLHEEGADAVQPAPARRGTTAQPPLVNGASAPAGGATAPR